MSKKNIRLPSDGLLLTPLEPQSRLGTKLLEIRLVCPQNGTAVLKGLRGTHNEDGGFGNISSRRLHVGASSLGVFSTPSPLLRNPALKIAPRGGGLSLAYYTGSSFPWAIAWYRGPSRGMCNDQEYTKHRFDPDVGTKRGFFISGQSMYVCTSCIRSIYEYV